MKLSLKLSFVVEENSVKISPNQVIKKRNISRALRIAGVKDKEIDEINWNFIENEDLELLGIAADLAAVRKIKEQISNESFYLKQSIKI